MRQGYIKLYRQIQDNPLWLSEKFTDGQAWIDLLLLANHAPGTIKKRGVRIGLNRGEIGWSEVALSMRWRWSRGKVHRFLNYLISEKMLKTVQQTVQQNKKLTTHVIIINYDVFQKDDTTNDTTDGHQTDIKQYRNNNNKNNKNGKNIHKGRTGFVKPSLSELSLYCEERKNTIDPQTFLDHYISNGWKVGKNSMKDWKATVRTWEKRDKKEQGRYL